jgi:hypothetical protein
MNCTSIFAKNGTAGVGLILKGILAFAFLATLAAPKAHADTLPTACTSTNANCPIIYKAPPELNTSADTANISGQRFGTDVSVYCELIDSSGNLQTGSKTSLSIKFANNALLQVGAPTNASGRQLMAIWVERVTGGVTYDSTVMFVNSPTINMVSETTVRPGSTLYMWGRWLTQTTGSYASSSVIFRGPLGDIPATITYGDIMQMQVTVPALTAGTSYSLVVANGWGGALGETTYGTPIIGGASGADAFNLGVYWGADFTFINSANTYDITSSSSLPLPHAVPNSTADQTAIFQAAINYVGTHSGGVIYIPAGTYVIDSELQEAYAKVVLQGAGASTILQYGASTTASTTKGIIVYTQDVYDVGFSKMTITNMFNEVSGSENGAIRIFAKGSSKIFLADVNFNLNSGLGLGMSNATDVVVTRCNIVQTRTDNNVSGYGDNGPFGAGSLRTTFTDNTVKYEEGRVRFTNTNYQIVMGNTITLDGTPANLNNLATNKLESGGVEFSFSDHVVYAKNTIQVSPAPDLTTLPAATKSFIYGCFELLLSQWSQYGMSAYGTVTSATNSGTTSTTLVDSTKNWTPGVSLTPPEASRTGFVAVTDGPGMGQIRNISSYTSDSITVEPAFDVLPTANSSRYTVSYFVTDTLVVQDNYLDNGQVGVEVYSGGINTSIRRNTIYGTHGIKLLGDDIINCDTGGCVNGYTYVRSLAWYADIIKNTVDNYDSPAVNNFPSSISVQAVQFENYPGYNEGLHGNTVFNVEVRANTIKAGNPNVAADYHNNLDGYYTVGAWGSNNTDAGTASPYPAPLVAVMGINMNGNNSYDVTTTYGQPTSTLPLYITANGVAGIQYLQNF